MDLDSDDENAVEEDFYAFLNVSKQVNFAILHLHMLLANIFAICTIITFVATCKYLFIYRVLNILYVIIVYSSMYTSF